MWIGFREFLGWVIVLVGLALIAMVLLLALNRSVFEAMALSFPAAIVFRAGIGLVRMSAAARIALSLHNRDAS
ncbi:hypothetical protein [Mariniblastus fucicola]|nr:hypothetical protein [Mariniblastus fucicola]